MQNAWIWIVVLVVVVAGGFIWWQSTQAQPSTINTTPTTNNTTDFTASTSTSDATGTSTVSAETASVRYDGTSFSPATITVKKGTTVTFTDTRNNQMWVASGPHPAHTGYDESAREEHCVAGYVGPKPFDQCLAGATYSFTFDQVGTWPYHDHLHATAFGKVIVEL